MIRLKSRAQGEHPTIRLWWKTSLLKATCRSPVYAAHCLLSVQGSVGGTWNAVAKMNRLRGKNADLKSVVMIRRRRIITKLRSIYNTIGREDYNIGRIVLSVSMLYFLNKITRTFDFRGKKKSKFIKQNKIMSFTLLIKKNCRYN